MSLFAKKEQSGTDRDPYQELADRLERDRLEREQAEEQRERKRAEWHRLLLEHWQDNPRDRLVSGWFILRSGKELGFVVESSIAEVLRDLVVEDSFSHVKMTFLNYWEYGRCSVSLRAEDIACVIERQEKLVLYKDEVQYIEE